MEHVFQVQVDLHVNALHHGRGLRVIITIIAIVIHAVMEQHAILQIKRIRAVATKVGKELAVRHQILAENPRVKIVLHAQIKEATLLVSAQIRGLEKHVELKIRVLLIRVARMERAKLQTIWKITPVYAIKGMKERIVRVILMNVRYTAIYARTVETVPTHLEASLAHVHVNGPGKTARMMSTNVSREQHHAKMGALATIQLVVLHVHVQKASAVHSVTVE